MWCKASSTKLEARLEHIKGALFANGGKVVGVLAIKAMVNAKRGRAARGELAAAGKAGMRVRDLAVMLGAKLETLHSWFQFARKNIRIIKKVGKGCYRLGRTTACTAATDAQGQAGACCQENHWQARTMGGSHPSQTENRQQSRLRVGDLAKKLNANPRNLFV
jgi:hypothetical protein